MTCLPRKPSLILIVFSCAAVALAGLSRHAFGDVITLNPLQDVTLFGMATGSTAAANPTSSGPGLFVGSDGSKDKRGIIQFNFAAIPAGSTITSATLTMYLGMWGGGSDNSKPNLGDQTTFRTIRLFDVTTSWNPSANGASIVPLTASTSPFSGSGQGSPPNANEATWNYAKFTSTPWITPGGDFVSSESADAQVGKTIQGSGYSWTDARMAQDIQGWLDHPLTNDGWLLKNDEESLQSFRAFYTTVPSLLPTLTVTFTPIPEPASLGILAIGSLALFARQRTRKA